eukprot:3976535-Pyramimonas_sp.AAC.1
MKSFLTRQPEVRVASTPCCLKLSSSGDDSMFLSTSASAPWFASSPAYSQYSGHERYMWKPPLEYRFQHFAHLSSKSTIWPVRGCGAWNGQGSLALSLLAPQDEHVHTPNCLALLGAGSSGAPADAPLPPLPFLRPAPARPPPRPTSVPAQEAARLPPALADGATDGGALPRPLSMQTPRLQKESRRLVPSKLALQKLPEHKWQR